MTLAICARCGSQKFDPFVVCECCGFEPKRPVDKAVAILLSEHNLSEQQLEENQLLIRSGGQVTLDPLRTVMLAEDIEDEDFATENFDPEGRTSKCKQCSTLFRSESHRTLCPACFASASIEFRICRKCRKAFPPNDRFCGTCGKPIDERKRVLPITLVKAPALLIRLRVAGPYLLWNESGYIGPSLAKLSPEDMQGAASEVEYFLIYVGLMALRSVIISKELVTPFMQAINDLYRRAYIASGCGMVRTFKLLDHIKSKIAEYEAFGGRFKNDIQALSYSAYMKVFHKKMEEHLGILLEWNSAIALTYQQLCELVAENLFKDQG